jgi:DNA-binding transcriptional regulator YhcF (GntR family)
MEWIFEQGRPIYTQIVEQIRINIANGTYEPGQQLPSVRDLAMEAAVNPNTMQRAFSELERDGLIYTVRTSGRFVTEEEGKLDILQKKLGQEFIEDLFEKLQKLGMSKKEIMDAIEEWAKEMK